MFRDIEGKEKEKQTSNSFIVMQLEKNKVSIYQHRENNIYNIKTLVEVNY